MKGIVLEGGGAKGAFHIGVMKALLDEGYTFDGIVGTSIGAFNAAMIAQGDFDKCYQLWQHLSPETLFDIENKYVQNIMNKEIKKETISYLSSEAKKIVLNKGIDVSKLKHILDTYIDEDKLRQSPIDFGLVILSLSDLKPIQVFKEDIPYGKVKEYIMASASLPVFKMEPLDGKYVLDGGFYDNCPINLLISKGYEDIIAIKVGGVARRQKISNPTINLLEIQASKHLGRILFFTNDLIKRNVQLGYLDAMKVIKTLKGTSYYIKPLEEQIIFDAISNIPDELIIEIGTEMNFTYTHPKRMLFEKIIPTISAALKLPSTATYQDVIIAILEVVAKERHVEKYKIYTLHEFIDAIQEEGNSTFIHRKSNSSIHQIKRHTIDFLKYIEITKIATKIVDHLNVHTVKEKKNS